MDMSLTFDQKQPSSRTSLENGVYSQISEDLEEVIKECLLASQGFENSRCLVESISRRLCILINGHLRDKLKEEHTKYENLQRDHSKLRIRCQELFDHNLMSIQTEIQQNQTFYALKEQLFCSQQVMNEQTSREEELTQEIAIFKRTHHETLYQKNLQIRSLRHRLHLLQQQFQFFEKTALDQPRQDQAHILSPTKRSFKSRSSSKKSRHLQKSPNKPQPAEAEQQLSQPVKSCVKELQYLLEKQQEATNLHKVLGIHSIYDNTSSRNDLSEVPSKEALSYLPSDNQLEQLPLVPLSPTKMHQLPLNRLTFPISRQLFTERLLRNQPYMGGVVRQGSQGDLAHVMEENSATKSRRSVSGVEFKLQLQSQAACQQCLALKEEAGQVLSDNFHFHEQTVGSLKIQLNEKLRELTYYKETIKELMIESIKAESAQQQLSYYQSTVQQLSNQLWQARMQLNAANQKIQIEVLKYSNEKQAEILLRQVSFKSQQKSERSSFQPNTAKSNGNASRGSHVNKQAGIISPGSRIAQDSRIAQENENTVSQTGSHWAYEQLSKDQAQRQKHQRQSSDFWFLSDSQSPFSLSFEASKKKVDTVKSVKQNSDRERSLRIPRHHHDAQVSTDELKTFHVHVPNILVTRTIGVGTDRLDEQSMGVQTMDIMKNKTTQTEDADTSEGYTQTIPIQKHRHVQTQQVLNGEQFAQTRLSNQTVRDNFRPLDSNNSSQGLSESIQTHNPIQPHYLNCVKRRLELDNSYNELRNAHTNLEVHNSASGRVQKLLSTTKSKVNRAQMSYDRGQIQHTTKPISTKPIKDKNNIPTSVDKLAFHDAMASTSNCLSLQQADLECHQLLANQNSVEQMCLVNKNYLASSKPNNTPDQIASGSIKKYQPNCNNLKFGQQKSQIQKMAPKQPITSNQHIGQQSTNSKQEINKNPLTSIPKTDIITNSQQTQRNKQQLTQTTTKKQDQNSKQSNRNQRFIPPPTDCQLLPGLVFNCDALLALNGIGQSELTFLARNLLPIQISSLKTVSPCSRESSNVSTSVMGLTKQIAILWAVSENTKKLDVLAVWEFRVISLGRQLGVAMQALGSLMVPDSKAIIWGNNEVIITNQLLRVNSRRKEADYFQGSLSNDVWKIIKQVRLYF